MHPVSNLSEKGPPLGAARPDASRAARGCNAVQASTAYLPKACVLTGPDDVAHHRELTPASQGKAVHCCDHGHSDLHGTAGCWQYNGSEPILPGATDASYKPHLLQSTPTLEHPLFKGLHRPHVCKQDASKLPSVSCSTCRTWRPHSAVSQLCQLFDVSTCAQQGFRKLSAHD